MEGSRCGANSSSSFSSLFSGRFMIPSVKEVALATADSLLHHNDDKRSSSSIGDEEQRRVARAKHCTDVGVRAGAKAAAYAAVASSAATFAGVRFVPWVRTNLNYTARALVISAATMATYFVVTEQTILACSRDASFAVLEKERAANSN